MYCMLQCAMSKPAASYDKNILRCFKGAYIECLVNELMMTTNEIEYKNTRLVMLSADAITTSQIALHILGVFSFLLTDKSCRVQLSTQGLFYPIAGDRNMWS